MTTIAHTRTWIAKHRVASEAACVSLLALIVFVTLAVHARSTLVIARSDLARLEAASAEIVGFRTSFRPAGESEHRRAESVDLGVPRDQRTALAHSIAERAEALGLSGVRVRFAELDSAAPPPAPDLVREPVAIADYTIVADFGGAFASVLTLVNRLPMSVALQRIEAQPSAGHTHFRIVLAVFESAASPSIGVASGEAAPHD